MKKIISFLSVILIAFVFVGAGCAPKNSQVKSTQENKQQAAATHEKAAATDTSGISQKDLDDLKKNINALDVQDLSGIK